MAWSRIWKQQRYTSLPGGDTAEKNGEGDALLSPSSSTGEFRSPQHQPYSITSIIVTAGCLLCTLANALILSRINSLDVRLDRFTPLPRPNPFIGLANINRTGLGITMELGPIITWPSTLTQISQTNKAYVFPDDSARFLTTFGSVSPEDRRFQVNDETHSVAQFRARDFGMEDCQVVFSISPRDSPVKIEGLKNYAVSMTTGEDSTLVRIGMWRLLPTAAAREEALIRPGTLSWNSRPQRANGSPLHTFAIESPILGGGVSESVHFPCARDSVHTFEFACVDKGCSLEFWQNGFQEDLGIFMKQHATV